MPLLCLKSSWSQLCRGEHVEEQGEEGRSPIQRPGSYRQARHTCPSASNWPSMTVSVWSTKRIVMHIIFMSMESFFHQCCKYQLCSYYVIDLFPGSGLGRADEILNVKTHWEGLINPCHYHNNRSENVSFLSWCYFQPAWPRSLEMPESDPQQIPWSLVFKCRMLCCLRCIVYASDRYCYLKSVPTIIKMPVR